LRHGHRHDLYGNPKNGKQQPVPRHNEIDEILAWKSGDIRETMGDSH
jgi:hypothetical protein